MSAPLRVGVIGCGGIAQMMHLPTLAERPDLFRIAGLADVSREVLDAVGARYGVAERHPDHRALLARDDVEAVLLLTSGCHREAALDTIASGKHLFVEKPLAFSLPETEEVAAAARRGRGKVMLGYHKRFDPAYLRARQAVAEMRDLRYVEVTVLHPDDAAARTHHAILPVTERPLAPEEQLVRGTLSRMTEGPLTACVNRILGPQAPLERRVGAFLLFESLLHDIDAVRGILGPPEAVVSAHVWRGGFAQSSLTRFPGDVRVQLSWILVPGYHRYEEALRFIGPDERVTLVFPSPYFRHFPTPLRIERMQGGELVVEEHTVSYEEAFRAELHEFRRCVRANVAPVPSVDDAVADARWMQAIAEAYA
jgi:predicted dehydrogenase